MAVVRSQHGTLAGTVVTTVTLATAGVSSRGGGGNFIEVSNWSLDPRIRIYCTGDGSAPAVGGDNTYCVPAGQTRPIPTGTGLAVKLIASVDTEYSVEAA